MVRKEIFLSFFALLVSCALAGCGSSGSANAPAQTALSLNGNWAVAGNRPLNQLPLLVVSLAVNGSEIDARGDVLVSCTTVLGNVALGGNFELTGQIAADGSFALAPAFAGGSVQIAIQGTVPATGSSTWSGSYTIADVTAPCVQQLSSNFTATALSAVSGVYAGTLPIASSSSQSPPLVVSATLRQGAPATIVRQSGNDSYLPLIGSITVTGSPCFTNGVTNPSAINEISGDLTIVSFTMDDGSQVLLNSTFNSQDESSARTLFNVIGGQCSLTSYGGTLMRQ